MPLSCSCSDDYEWYFKIPNDYTVFRLTGRRKRCSCGTLIEHGAVCLEFECFKMSETDDEIPLAARWLCERCSDLFFSFAELGYTCVSPDENMIELVNDYEG